MKETLAEIWRSMVVAFEAVFEGTEEAIQRIESSKSAKKYIYGFRALATLVIFPPILPMLIGMWLEKGWLISTAGLWCAGWTIALLVWGTPIGVIVGMAFKIKEHFAENATLEASSLLKGEKSLWESGGKYFIIVRAVILWEAIFFLSLTWIPVRNHPELIPTALLLIVALVVMNYHWNMTSTWLRPLLWYGSIALFIIVLTKFFLAQDLTIQAVTTWYHSNAWETSTALMWVIILAALALIAGIASLWGTPAKGGEAKSSSGHTSASGHKAEAGGEKKGGVSGIQLAWGLAVIALLIFLVTKVSGNSDPPNQNLGGGSSVEPRPQHYFTTAPLQGEVSVDIPENMRGGIEAAHQNEPFYARVEGIPGRVLDWKGKVLSEEEKNRFHTPGATRIWLQSATNVPVQVEVTLTPK